MRRGPWYTRCVKAGEGLRTLDPDLAPLARGDAAQARHGELATDDQHDQPRRYARAGLARSRTRHRREHDEHRHDDELVRERIEELAEGRDDAVLAREIAVEI